MSHSRTPFRRFLSGAAALALLAACNEPIDFDLRDFGGGFDTTEVALNAQARPAPDAQGVITYPTYRVAVAQRDETVRGLAQRLGLNAEEVARLNGISPDAPLRRDELVALPGGGGGTAPGAAPVATGGVDVATLAGNAIDRSGVTSTALPPAGGTAAPAAAPQPGIGQTEPVRHQVARGETVYTIARRYNVDVGALARLNNLGADLAVREGQQILIPIGATPTAAPSAAATAPGEGSAAPLPPSAAEPLPDNEVPAAEAAAEIAAEPTPAPDLGAEQTAAPASSAMSMPAQGSIIRAYAPGRNEGIDIGAAAGAEVRAAATGVVAAITTNTEGIQIVVIRHDGGLLTVYTHLENLSVAKDDRVSQGQVIGRVRPGDPSFLHFEVRRGMQSLDPADFLPL
jgi:lipoprotein NlpD